VLLYIVVHAREWCRYRCVDPAPNLIRSSLTWCGPLKTNLDKLMQWSHCRTVYRSDDKTPVTLNWTVRQPTASCLAYITELYRAYHDVIYMIQSHWRIRAGQPQQLGPLSRLLRHSLSLLIVCNETETKQNLETDTWSFSVALGFQHRRL